jgi:hypothetical protein
MERKMKRLFALPSRDGLITTLAISVAAFFMAQPPSAGASQKKEARVTQVIQDVQLVASNVAPRPAALNDNVQEGTAVRTGQASRTELTFTDKTLTRLGANSVFSFNVGTGTYDLGQGALLMQVPPNGSSVKVKTAAVTAAITGGTAIFGTGPPTKFMVLEGTGTFYPAGHPEEAVTLHGGEMVTLTPDGHIVGPVAFDVKQVLETSELITDFPDLANLPLILAVIREQEALYTADPPTLPPKDPTDIIDQRTAAEEAQNSTGPSDKFGPLSTINSPDPYVINSGTQIQTDPTITTNGVTDLGKIYRGSDTDGAFTAYAFGATSSFDTASGINHTINDSGAVFKFTSLQLTGNPTVSTTGGETSLGLIGVNGVTSGGPGGTLTFAGIQGLLIATENGSISLGSEISFAGLHDLNIYARGSGSNLTLGSAISTDSEVNLFSQGNIQVNGNVDTTDFTAFSGGDFLQNGGVITATTLNIRSLSNITLDASKIPDGGGGPITLNAANTLTINNITGGPFGRVSLSGNGATINLNAADAPAMFDFSQSNSVTFTAGTGGINASSIDFFGQNLTLNSLGDISVHSVTTPFDKSENPILTGTITAGGSFLATGNVFTGTFSVNSATIGGELQARDITTTTDLSADAGVTAVGGSINVGGNLTAMNGSIQLGQDPPGTFGNITVGGNIIATQGIFTPGNPVVVHADGSITASGAITGTLEAGTNMTFDNSADEFFSSVIANHISAGGTITFINTPAISPNNGGSGGNDGETFDDFSMTAGSITSTGPTFPVLSSNGGDANPDFDDSNPGNGGNITINITLAGLSVGDAQNLDSISANGGAFNTGGPYNGGNGGKVDITAAGDVSISDGADAAGISATTGIVSDIFSEFGGEGGTVNITSSGRITVDGTVQVSSDDAGQFAARPEGEETPGRESASGGTIHLQSNLTTGPGITIGADGQLLSLLGFDAPGDSGSITLSTMGADIVVNGTVRADFGTVTLDQDDPPGATPTITLDGGTVQSATFNINGSGDLIIGPNNATAVNIFGGTWNVAHDITINAENTSFAYSFALNAMAGNAINFTGGNSDTAATLTLPLSGDTTFTAGTGGINAQFVNIHYAGAGLDLITAGSVTANSIAYTDFFTRGTLQAGGSITIAGDLFEGDITAGTSISVGGSIQANTVGAGTTLDVTFTLQASTVITGGNVTAGQMTVQTFSAPNGTLTVQNRILPYVFSTDPNFPAQGAKAPHVITANTIASPNGIDFSGDQFGGIDGYTSGGILTINASQILINTDISSAIGNVNFNGADAGATDFSGNVFTTVGGDGGTFTANATGDITVDSAISATTGNNLSDPLNPSAAEYHGVGGTVSLHSDNGTVAVNSTIQVSSDEPVPFSTATPQPYRKSASGGNINLISGKTSGVAINVGSSSQLLSLLNAAAPGPGGKITIVASATNNTGNSSQINIDNSNGLIAADGPGGTVDIEHHGESGTININNANIRADVVKVGAFGNNGILNIGGGVINADTILKLYAPGSNGQLNFIANVTLSSNTAATLAANTITIQPTVIVNIAGAGGPANVYTNNPNYNFTPGSGYTGPAGNPANGSFSGNGAHDPQPLPGAPTF